MSNEMAITWELEQHFEQYRDYELEIPDVNEHGGRIRLTIDTEERKAYITLTLDNEDEEIFLEGVSVDVPLPWAIAVAYGTDGFILPTKEPVA